MLILLNTGILAKIFCLREKDALQFGHTGMTKRGKQSLCFDFYFS